MPEIKRQDAEKVPLLKLIIGNVWLYFTVAILVAGGTIALHTLPNIKELEKTKLENNSMKGEIIALEEKIKTKKTEQEKAAQDLGLFEEKYNPRINKVLPIGENLHDLTRFLESYALQLEKAGTMTLTAISFGGPAAAGEYSKLPIRLSFQADPLNFIRFMQLIKNSGSIEEKDFYNGEPIRLMQVDQISVSIPSFKETTAKASISKADEPLYSINIQISAFFRNAT